VVHQLRGQAGCRAEHAAVDNHHTYLAARYSSALQQLPLGGFCCNTSGGYVYICCAYYGVC
jgi:hypothetical protein